MTLGFNFDAVPAGKDSWGRTVYMARAAAPYLLGLTAEYESTKDPDGDEWGTLVVLEGGRLIARQQYLWDGYAKGLPGFNIAAYPGTGMHDKDGRAVDFGAGWNSYSQLGWKRLNSIAGKWGFNNRQGRATGKNGEPWHWVWEPGTAQPGILATVSAAGVYDISALPKEDELSAEAERKITEIYNAIFNGGTSMADQGRSVSETLALIRQVSDQLAIPIIADPRTGSLYFASPQTGVRKISDYVSGDMDNKTVVDALNGAFGRYHTPASAWEFDVLTALIQRHADDYQARLVAAVAPQPGHLTNMPKAP